MSEELLNEIRDHARRVEETAGRETHYALVFDVGVIQSDFVYCGSLEDAMHRLYCYKAFGRWDVHPRCSLIRYQVLEEVK